MVRSHSRLPIPLPGATSGPTAAFGRSRTLFETLSESRMLKFLGSTVGIIFLIGLVVVIVLLKLIF